MRRHCAGMEEAMTFGEKVKELRTRKGLSQEDLAAMAGVTVRTVRNWETGGKYPRSRELYAKLADALDCNEEYLRGEQELFLMRAGEEYGTRGQRQGTYSASNGRRASRPTRRSRSTCRLPCRTWTKT